MGNRKVSYQGEHFECVEPGNKQSKFRKKIENKTQFYFEINTSQKINSPLFSES